MHVIIFMSWPLYPRHKGPGTHLIGSWMHPGLNVKFLPGIVLGLSISYPVIFTRFRETSKSDYQLRHVCPSISLSVCVKQLRSHLMESHKLWSLRIYWNSIEKIQVLLNSDTNNGHIAKIYIYIYIIIISRWILMEMNNISDKVVEKIKSTFHVQ